MQKYARFLGLYHAGHVGADDIDDFIAAWHATPIMPVALHVHLGMTWAEYRRWGRDARLPTRAEHRREPGDAIFIEPGQGVLLAVHSPVHCRPPCPVHWPSDHPLAGAPLDWDRQDRIVVRRCPHGLTHPDPDDQQVRLHPALAEHACDGCCTARVVEGDLTATGAMAAILQSVTVLPRRDGPAPERGAGRRSA